MDIKYVFSQTMFASYAEAFVLTDAFWTAHNAAVGSVFVVTVNLDAFYTLWWTCNSMLDHIKGALLHRKYRMTLDVCSYQYWRRNLLCFINEITN
jgi:hypothetical protein